LDGEEAVIKRVKDKIAKDALARKLEQKQGETDIETAAANAKTLFNATDPRVLAGKLTEKYGADVAGELAKQNAERVALDMPPMTMAEFDQSAARIMGGGGIPRPTQPVAPAYGSTSQTTPGGPAPVSAPPVPVAPTQTGAAPAPVPLAPAPRPMSLAEARARQAGMKQTQEEIGKDIGQTAAGLGRRERSAESAIGLVDNLINHPGFEWAVGGQPLERIGGAISGSFRGTDVTDFKALRDQLGGTQFLQAIETLKGSGSVSEKEGETATRAISTMSNPDVSEAEFKRAATEFTNIMKRGINADRRKLGLPPKFEEPAAPGTTPYGNKPLLPGAKDVPAGSPQAVLNGRVITVRGGKWVYADTGEEAK
jgi:hypothetical protein